MITSGDLIKSKMVDKIIKLALQEDLGNGDITTNALVPEHQNAFAYLLVKEKGIIAGLDVCKKIFQILDKNIKWVNLVFDGGFVKPKTKLALLEGNYRAILTGERTALNFLQRISGVATLTNQFVKKLNGLNTRILDTRKTLPGFRLLDKYAVALGGGSNHRIGLYDMVMIKDNHIRIAGGITNAVKQIRKSINKNIKIEVETTNLDEVAEALSLKVNVIMLDNMSIPIMKKAVKLINGKTKTEASGGINLDNVRKVALTGVDFVSIGAITHSSKGLDISLEIDSNY
ncbi:MAG: carboxylating nicotinate-nucleotide diphosphorylase [Ignavibacteriales bacterium]|nr:carboxylating nicotinate-nucleotide diphosphorylase [Ignavibacteriales bacterium]